MDTVVIKIGGKEVDNPHFLAQLAEVIRTMEARPVVVHGGGREIARLQERLGIKPRFVEGLRVTDEASLELVQMVLSGLVNKRLVAHLVAAGVEALGLSGVDLGLIRVERMRHPRGDLGRVGQIVEVRGQVLADLLARGIVPVVSPVSLGRDGLTYNVNADHAGLAIARAIGAASLVFVTDVPGVLIEGRVVGQLTATEAGELIASGVIAGGMVPKVRSALEAVADGVQARITDLAGLGQGGGTTFVDRSKDSEIQEAKGAGMARQRRSSHHVSNHH
ncbi:MAG: acetylglutamate kinase [Anaerolineae bacterium]